MQEENTFIRSQEGQNILGVPRQTFFYYVNNGHIEKRPGKTARDARYSLRDILKVKEDRRANKSKAVSHFVLDWLYANDLPACLALDYKVYEEYLIGDISHYATWLNKNNHVALAAYDKTDRSKCLAYLCMLPLPETAILDIMAGKRDELSIQADEIQTYDQPGEYTLLANSAVVHPDHPTLLYAVLNGIMQYWLDQYPDRRVTRIYAQAASPAGDVLIQKFYFAPLYDLKSEPACVIPNAYVLDLSRPGASRVIRSFQKALESKHNALDLPEQEPSYLPELPQADQDKPKRTRKKTTTDVPATPDQTLWGS